MGCEGYIVSFVADSGLHELFIMERVNIIFIIYLSIWRMICYLYYD